MADKSIIGPYAPGPVPYTIDDVPRFLEEELHRIKQAFEAQPAAMTITTAAIIDVDPPPAVWARLFVGVDAEYDVPSGSWDSVLGQYTNSVDGLYNIAGSITLSPFGSGNKNYYATLRATVVHADGSPDTVLERTDSAQDDVPLSVNLNVNLPWFQGDILYYEAAAVHELFTGTTTVGAYAQLTRQSQ